MSEEDTEPTKPNQQTTQEMWVTNMLLSWNLCAILNENQANYDEVKTRLCRVCFVVVVVVNVVVVLLIVVAVHKGLVVVDKSLSDTH